LPRLKELLEPRGLFRRTAPAEVRACAIHGLAQVRTLEARLLVDRFTSDKEAVVRSAANAVLREWRV
jgi:HEAT repeat protein